MRQQGKYSQNSEDAIIESYFTGFTGTLLSIGENDGKSLSNVLSAIERGWKAVLIEPSKTAFANLRELHDKNPDVRLYNVAIGEQNGEADFYESGEHLGCGDTSLISTLIETETDRWKGSRFDNFTKTKTDVVTWEKFYSELPFDNMQFDLVSIDCEGLDLFILQQMNLSAMGVKMLIVEFNGKDENLFTIEADKAGLKLYHKNGENLIFVK